jgi:tetratricopeptide (TPR) repeat protein
MIPRRLSGGFFATALVAATALAAAVSPAAAQSDGPVCIKPPTPEVGVAACTRLIRSGRFTGHKLSVAYHNRGFFLRLMGDLDRAIADYDQAIRLHASDANYYVNRGFALNRRGDDDRALADFDRAIRLNPKVAVAYINRGNIYYNKGEYDRALPDFEQAIRLDPNNASAYTNRGSIMSKRGDDDRALADHDRAIRLNPNLALAYSNRASILIEKGKYDGALADFEHAIRLDPKLAPAYAGRASIWKLKGDDDRVLADLNEAIRIDPRLAVAYGNRGSHWMDKGEFDRALADFDQAIRLQPHAANHYTNRGNAWREKGDLDRALADQDKAISLASSERREALHKYRGDTRRYRGDLAGALADYDEALRRLPSYAPAMLGRGLVFEKQGNFAAARAEFERTVTTPDRGLSEIESAEARETARARLAALESGAPQPVIPAAPAKAGSATSIPTPAIAAPVVTTPVAPAVVQATAAKQGRRVALIVGNSAYQKVSALPNPQRDAVAVAAALRNIGFEVVTLAGDATREKLIDALRAFANEAEKADWAVVYYAGHGIEVNGVNYLIPVDAKLAVDRDVQFEAVPLEQVMTAVEGARRLKLVILDACRDNPFTPQMRKSAAPGPVASATTAGGNVGTRSVGRGLAEVKVSAGSLVVYAAKHGQVALDGEGDNSPFAVALVQRIATPGVEINKIFRLVRDDVMEATAGRQEPFTYGSLPGREDFFFVAAR